MMIDQRESEQADIKKAAARRERESPKLPFGKGRGPKPISMGLPADP